MGVAAVEKHRLGKKHTDLAKAASATSVTMSRFFGDPREGSRAAETSESETPAFSGASSTGPSSLSHASVERGFSVHKEVTETNLSKESLIARRHIAQVVEQHGGPHMVPITKELLIAASSARGKYYEDLEEEKKREAAGKKTQKRKAASDLVDSLKAKIAKIQEDIDSLSARADKLFEQAEEEKTFTLVTAGNALKGKAREKREEVVLVKQQLEKAMSKLKELD